MTERAVGFPSARLDDRAIRTRCPVCRAQLMGVFTRPNEPHSELTVVCTCGFELVFEGPGLMFDRRRIREDQ